MSDTHQAIDAVWRIESASLVAALARIVRDVGLAEDLAQDALVAALEKWPESGVPDNPGAWLMATAKHRAIDLLRKRTLHQRKEGEIGREIDARLQSVAPNLDAALDDDIGDDGTRGIIPGRLRNCHAELQGSGGVRPLRNAQGDNRVIHPDDEWGSP